MRSSGPAGQSLLEIMIAAALVAIGISAVIQISGRSLAEYKTQRASSTRSRLILQLDRVVGMPGALHQSYNPGNPSFNPNFYNCMENNSSCDHTRTYDAAIYCPSYDPATGKATCPIPQVTGTRSNPVYYDSMGYPCTSTNGICPVSAYPFAAYTTIQAVCPVPYVTWGTGPDAGTFDPAAVGSATSLYTTPANCSVVTGAYLIQVTLHLITRNGSGFSFPDYTYTMGTSWTAINNGLICIDWTDNDCY